MALQAAFFYLFAFVTIASGLMVIAARNPVHAVLFLILAFFNAAGLFLLMGAEFLAMILVIVYVGAVAVLFLFVVMMLDVDFAELRSGFLKNAPLGLVIGLGLLAELVLVLGATAIDPSLKKVASAASPIDANVTNTVALGRVLYTKYAYFFEAAGLILLTAMIGAIVLDACATRKASSARTSRPRTPARPPPAWRSSRCRRAATRSPRRPPRTGAGVMGMRLPSHHTPVSSRDLFPRIHGSAGCGVSVCVANGNAHSPSASASWMNGSRGRAPG